MSFAESWNSQVESHHAQSLRAQEKSPPPDDFWRPFASSFRLDPRRTDDAALNRLVSEVSRDSAVLDVGGGAGRFALPLALRCRRVIVVEPSESMLSELHEGAREAGIENVSVVQRAWEEAEVEAADIVLCAHVTYGIADIVPFIRKLESHATDRVLLLSFMESPQSGLSPVWELVHGEERVDLPGLRELLPVLWELDAYPDLVMIETTGPQSFETREAALEQLRRRMYVGPDTEEDRRLQAALREVLIAADDGFVIRGAGPMRQGLLSWRPD